MYAPESAPGAAATRERILDAAEALFRRALDVSRTQGAVSLELRAASSLARLQLDRGERELAHALLAPVRAKISEGAGTADLRAADELLERTSR